MPKVAAALYLDLAVLEEVDRLIEPGGRSKFMRESLRVMLWLNRRWPECWTAERMIAQLEKTLRE
ncbi:MAG: hypothetical protein FJZ90_03045 [Chloroflexi bacterium]|nr:hypothetical protein [Chloroflexota bacterium]